MADIPNYYVAKAGPVYWKGEHVATLVRDVKLSGRCWGEQVSRHELRWPDGRELANGEQFPIEVRLGILEKAGKPLPDFGPYFVSPFISAWMAIADV